MERAVPAGDDAVTWTSTGLKEKDGWDAGIDARAVTGRRVEAPDAFARGEVGGFFRAHDASAGRRFERLRQVDRGAPAQQPAARDDAGCFVDGADAERPLAGTELRAQERCVLGGRRIDDEHVGRVPEHEPAFAVAREVDAVGDDFGALRMARDHRMRAGLRVLDQQVEIIARRLSFLDALARQVVTIVVRRPRTGARAGKRQEEQVPAHRGVYRA